VTILLLLEWPNMFFKKWNNRIVLPYTNQPKWFWKSYKNAWKQITVSRSVGICTRSVLQLLFYSFVHSHVLQYMQYALKTWGSTFAT